MEVSRTRYLSSCRLCLKDDASTVPIFGDGDNLAQKILSCVSVQVFKTDLFPTIVCEFCMERIDSWYNFKKICDDSQAKLREWLNTMYHGNVQNTSFIVKEEPIQCDYNYDFSVEDDILETDITVKSELGCEVGQHDATNINDDARSTTSTNVNIIFENETATSPVSTNYTMDENGIISDIHSETNASASCSEITARDSNSFAGAFQQKIKKRRRYLKGKKPLPKCDDCGNRFANKQNLIRHRVALHGFVPVNNRTTDLRGERQSPPNEVENGMELDTNESNTMSSINSAEKDNADNLQDDRTEGIPQITQVESIRLSPDVPDFRGFELENNSQSSVSQTQEFGRGEENFQADNGVPEENSDLFACKVCLKSFSNVANARRHEVNAHKYHRRRQFKQLTRLNLISAKSKVIKKIKNSNLARKTLGIVKNPLKSKLQFAASLNLMANKKDIKEIQKQFVIVNKDLLEMIRNSKCSYCKKSMNKTKLLKHLRLMHKIAIPPYQCYDCLIPLGGRSEYKRHISQVSCKRHSINITTIHAPEENSRPEQVKTFECKICTDSFPSEEEFGKHIVSAHILDMRSIETPLMCSQCNNSYEIADNLNKHIMSGECILNITCNLCNGNYSSTSEFDAHECSPPAIIKTEPDIDVQIEPDDEIEVDEEIEIADEMEEDDAEPSNKLDGFSRPKDCPICGKQYSSYNNLKRHMLVHDNRNKPFKCSFCSVSFRLKTELKNHAYLEHNEIVDSNDGLNFTCDICNVEFDDIAKWTEHRAQHSESFTCKTCKKSFISNFELSTHMETHKLKVKIYTCSLCPMSYNSVESLNEHTGKHRTVINGHAVTPPGSERFECNVCLASLGSKNSLWKHKQIHLRKGEPYGKGTKHKVCNICNKVVLSLTALISHKKTHASMRPSGPSYKCRVCRQIFYSYMPFYRHMKKAHSERLPKRDGSQMEPVQNKTDNEDEQNSVSSEPGNKVSKFACDYCDKVCISHAGLLKHKAIHSQPADDSENVTAPTETREAPKHPCNYCDKVCLTAAALVRHKTIHWNDPLPEESTPQNTGFACENCNEVCATESELIKHNASHETEYTLDNEVTHSKVDYPCDECDKICTTAASLVRHKTVHCPDKSEFPCDSCDKICITLAALVRHKTVHTRSAPQEIKEQTPASSQLKSFPCDRCDKVCSTMAALVKHRTVHFGMPKLTVAKKIKQARFMCKMCPKSFITEAALIVHKGWHVRATGLKDSSGTANEEAKSGTKSVSYKCHICLARCKSFKHLRIHVRQYHTGTTSKPKKKMVSDRHCLQCRVSFPSAEILQDHLLLHKNQERHEKMWECDQCDRGFSRYDTLCKHLKDTHDHTVTESEREALFTKASMPQTALLDKNGVDVNYRWYTCTICNLSYESAKALRSHISTHMPSGTIISAVGTQASSSSSSQEPTKPSKNVNGRKFTCRVCSKVFSKRMLLSNHIRDLHFDASSVYKCRKCQNVYMTKQSLFRHENIAHSSG